MGMAWLSRQGALNPIRELMAAGAQIRVIAFDASLRSVPGRNPSDGTQGPPGGPCPCSYVQLYRLTWMLPPTAPGPPPSAPTPSETTFTQSASFPL